MEYLMLLILGLLFLYLFILKGLPWIASKYASYRFGAHVGVKTIDFISRSLRDVSFKTRLTLNSTECPNEATISLAVDEVLLTTNFFSGVYSTLIVVKLNGVRVRAHLESLGIISKFCSTFFIFLSKELLFLATKLLSMAAQGPGTF